MKSFKKKIMKKLLYTFAIVGLLLVSCKKEEAAVEETVTAVDSTSVAADGVAVVDPTAAQIQPVQPDANGGNPNTIMRQMVPNPAAQQTATTTQMVSQQVAAPVKVGKGMNPSHGQPGHRCDIAVGAPLNSPPGKPSATPQPATSSQFTSAQATVPNSPNAVLSADGKTTTTTTSTPVVTPEGMNPPHGQAGHVCSVAVGAPLPK